VYAEHPDALTRKYRPASNRDAEPSWWFLCHCKLQTTRGGGPPRCERRVVTGGCWKLEQTKEEIRCAATRQRLGFKRSFGFYVKTAEKEEEDEMHKTWWLMEEFTSVVFPEDGVVRDDGKRVLPALYRIYPTPRDHDKKEKKSKKKRVRNDDRDKDGAPIRLVVPADYFDAVEALLSESTTAQGVGQGQEQTQDTEEEAPPTQDTEEEAPPTQDTEEEVLPTQDTEEKASPTQDTEEKAPPTPPPPPSPSPLRGVVDLYQGQEQTQETEEEAPPPPSPSPLRGVVDLYQGQEQTQDTEEAPPPSPLRCIVHLYQGYDASPGDNHMMNIHDEMCAVPEEGQSNPDGGESRQLCDILLPANDGITPVWQMGRSDAFKDCSWIESFY
jgi:hypothetical protein